ncbi:hypothetical protein KJ785_03275 [Patescibacteria group bacterium]|nr:hypothetical protein [Patescibacteria group bacterium]
MSAGTKWKIVVEISCEHKEQESKKYEVNEPKEFNALEVEGPQAYLSSYISGFKYGCNGMCPFCKMKARVTLELEIEDNTAFDQIYSKA